MRRLVTTALTAAALLVAVPLGAAPPAGRLPGTVRPTAYRLELTVDPAQKSFTGRTEIDAVLTETARTIYLHGNGLRVSIGPCRSDPAETPGGGVPSGEGMVG